LRGLPSPGQLAQTAARHNQVALTLTDRDTLTGSIEFYEACLSHNLKPILGLELAFDEQPLALLATSLLGWRNLCCLSSLLNTTGLRFDQLADYSTDLICLTPIAYATRLRDHFPDRLYLELSSSHLRDSTTVQATLDLAQTLTLPVVAAPDLYYLDPNHADLQRTLTAIRLNTPRDRLPEAELAPPDSHFRSPSEIKELYKHFPQALAASQEIAERCNLQLPIGVQHYPEVQLPPGLSALEVLAQKARTGARGLYGGLTPEIETRLDHELNVIGEKGYAPLFLIVEEILDHARAAGVPISSRGSAASSLVAHCLGITSPDPLRLNLYFERFLNPARSTPPDIDTDLCSRRRDGVIQHVYDQYGHDRVAMVCTINRFRSRSALREVAKAYGLPEKEVKTLTDALPYRWWGPPNHEDKRKSPFAEIREQHRSPLHQDIFKTAEAILGLPRHLSIHPGGVVISPGPMTDLVPTYLATKGIVITQFDLDSIERLGLIKIDLLGIRGLTVLGDVVEQTSEVLKTSEVLEKDAATSESVRNGRTIGCFQIESPGMRATLKEIDAKSVDDVMTALALYRPGPLTGGLKDAFVRRHLGLEPIKHLHPALAPLLQDTYGVILYQEQVLRIAHELAGLSLADADLLRRAMSHFDPGKQMQTLKNNFVAGAERKSNVPRDIAERVWELMAAFAGYGFPKAHAASYAQVAWRSAWCKVHFPAEFMASVLANWGGYYSQRVYLTEARRMGLAIRPPHINYAETQFSVKRVNDQPKLYMGLDQVRDLTRRTQANILRERPFLSLYDFLSRVDPRPDEAANLIKVGALDGFGHIPNLLRQLKQDKWEQDQLALFEMKVESEADWSLAQKVEAQETLLGTGVDAHPLELLADKITEANALTTVGAAAKVGQRVRVAGMRQTWRRTATIQGAFIYFMALEDLEGVLDVVIFGDVYRRYRSAMTDAGPYVIEGLLEIGGEQEEPVVRAEKIWRV
jgi:DNA-directed DNA polymerase III PolC